MEKIYDGNGCVIERVDKDEYISNSEEVNRFMMRLIASHEYENNEYDFEEAKQMLEDLNLNLFTNESLNVRLYMLKSKVNNDDICFALYSQDETREDWHLEYIVTHSDYAGCGFAKALFDASARDLVKTGLTEISSVVAKNNKASLRLHDQIGDIEGIKLYCDELDEDRYAFVFDVKDINKNKMEEEDCLF